MKNPLLFVLFSIFLCGACHEDAVQPDKDETHEDTLSIDSTAADSTSQKSQEAVKDTIATDSIKTDTVDADTIKDPVKNYSAYYFPPNDGDTWENITPESLGWDIEKLNDLLAFVKEKNTSGFIILHKGRMVSEHYWNDWDLNTASTIASAGKSITSFLVGIAQQEGRLNINNKTADYLGEGWTSCTPAKEKLITVKHQLSMTTGLDETEDPCVAVGCLRYKADAGKRWAYHNAPYNLLQRVIEEVSNMSMSDFTKTRLAEKIGMKHWDWNGFNIDLSARDMARFGLLILQEGTWNGQPVMTDKTYLNDMISSSNDLNKSYGYLWWLNGQPSYMIPLENGVNQGQLVSSAPADMFAAMGKGDKKIYVVPSLDLVVVRHGEDTGENTFGPSSFDEALWQRLKNVIKY